MALFDTSCSLCSIILELRGKFDEVDGASCACGGIRKVFFSDMFVSMDATPTQSWGRMKSHSNKAPKLVKADGTELNPGHESVNASHIRLNQDQVNRLEL